MSMVQLDLATRHLTGAKEEKFDKPES